MKKDILGCNLYVSKTHIFYPQIELLMDELYINKEDLSLYYNKKYCNLNDNTLENVILRVLKRNLSCYSENFLKEMIKDNDYISKTMSSLENNKVKKISSESIEEFFEFLLNEYEICSINDIQKYIISFHKKYLKW